MNRTLGARENMQPISKLMMAYRPDEARRALQSFLDTHSLSARGICAAADLSPSAVSQFLAGRVNSLKSSTYEALAVGAGKLIGREVTASELRGDSTTEMTRHAKMHGVRDAAKVTVPLRTEMERDLPILGSVSGGVGGLAQVDNGTAIDFALRPHRLVGRTDVAAFWVEDLSMGEAYKPGSLVVVEKKRPPQVHDDVVFELLPESPKDERRALIKRFLGRTPTVYKFQQFNPPKMLEYPVKRVANLMRVIPLSELLGV